MTDDGPFCPECAEPVSAGTEYCMHCYQNFDGDVSPVDTPPAGASTTDAPDSGEGYGEWDGADQQAGADTSGQADSPVPDASEGYDQWDTGGRGEVLDPEGIVDNTLTVIVGIVAGLVIGMISMIMLGVATDSGWGVLLGFVAWLGSTAHLVRRYTVQGAISHAGYALAIVLALIPFIAALAGGPGIEDRLSNLFAALMFVSIPAVISAVVGLIAGKIAPEKSGGK